jgi:MraZ protein
MLFGQLSTSINKKGQIIIPSNLAAILSKRAFITQGLDRNLLLIPENAFQFLYEQLQGLNLANPKARLLLRVFLGNAYETVLSPSNRLDLPDSLIKFAYLENQAILIGQGNFIEIWNPIYWSKQELFYQDVETDPERFCQFKIAFG